MSDYERIAREALERAEKATDGPWAPDLDVSDADDPEIEAGVISDNLTVWFTSGTEIMCKEQGDWERARASQAYKDAEFIAHARQDVPALARAVLDQQKTIEDLEQEVKLADDDARKMRDAYCDSLRDWAEGGKVWKMEAEIERLQSELSIEKASQATRGNN